MRPDAAGAADRLRLPRSSVGDAPLVDMRLDGCGAGGADPGDGLAGDCGCRRLVDDLPVRTPPMTSVRKVGARLGPVVAILRSTGPSFKGRAASVPASSLVFGDALMPKDARSMSIGSVIPRPNEHVLHGHLCAQITRISSAREFAAVSRP